MHEDPRMDQDGKLYLQFVVDRDTQTCFARIPARIRLLVLALMSNASNFSEFVSGPVHKQQASPVFTSRNCATRTILAFRHRVVLEGRKVASAGLILYLWSFFTDDILYCQLPCRALYFIT